MNILYDVKTYFKKDKLIHWIMLLVLLCFIILMSVLVKNRYLARDLPQIVKSGRIVIVTENSRVGFHTTNNNIAGFQYEIAKAFADTIGVELVMIKENDMLRCIEGLQNQYFDIVASFIPPTTQWKKHVQFTSPVSPVSRQVLVQRIDSTHKKILTKQLELASKIIAIPLHSPYKIFIEHLSEQIAAKIYTDELPNKTTEELVHMVSNGKLNYTICDEMLAEKLQLELTNIDVSLPIAMEQKQVWAVRKNSNKLRQELNDFLDNFIGSSDYWAIYRKYY